VADDTPSGGPRIDGRRREAIHEDVRGMVPYYVDDWTPDESDVGATLLALFGELAEEVTERLDRLPEKHRIAFYDTLGFDRLPPQPARLPLTVTVADRAGENVTVSAGTRVTAKPPDGAERLFEVLDGWTFDATPATLQAVYSVDPDADAIYRHHDAIGGGSGETSGPGLFDSAADNRQRHTVYVGDAEQLAVGTDTTLAVELDTDTDPDVLHGDLRWEYYGERTVGDETVTGWHPFPSQVDYPGLLAGVSEFGIVHRLEERGYEWDAPYWYAREWLRREHPRLFGVYEYLVGSRSAPPGAAPRTDGGAVVLEFDLDGTLATTTVDGVESKWIRARAPVDASTEVFRTAFGSIGTNQPPVAVGGSAAGLSPDAMLHNDIPQPQGADASTILPFGKRPRQQDTFYLASTEAFTKRGAEVTVDFQEPSPQPGDSGSDPPALSWEYFDGSGWTRLDLESDGTRSLRDGGKVTFEVPGDLAKTAVAGHESHWVRVRLVGGDYGEMEFEFVSGNPDTYEQQPTYAPPTFERIDLSYDRTAPPAHALAENNRQFGPDHAAEGTRRYRPFRPVPGDHQTLYLGFDAPLADGPINVFFDLEDAAYPPDFYPQLRWEFDDGSDWARLDVLDDTEGLTERGIVGLVFPKTTVADRRFGHDLHWVRARVTGDAFGSLTGGADGTNGSAGDAATEGCLAPCGRTVETVPPAGEPERYPPAPRGIYPNATWAADRRTVDGETLGSSDGSVDQTFTVAHPPVVECDLWVDELAVRSEGARAALRERWPDRTAVETDAAGETTAFWVRWTRQPDLLDSGPEDRHFVLDPIAGTVSFGDGTRGMIPPRGTANVRATYVTGGGAAGNVPAGAVSGFQQSLAFVDAVTNPVAAAAGADAEPTAAVADRAARELRDRNRAVAPADYERLAMDASRRLARARCLPAMDREGAYRPGWVTVLIVPESAAPRPAPSATLRETVHGSLADHAPAALVGVDQLVVRGPSYVTARVDADIVATGGSIADLEKRARVALRSFLHPLTGGPDGEGWPFGTLPCRSDLYELLEGIDRVDHVEALSLVFDTDESTVRVAEGEPTPDTSPDALVHSGSHDIGATLGGDR